MPSPTRLRSDGHSMSAQLRSVLFVHGVCSVLPFVASQMEHALQPCSLLAYEVSGHVRHTASLDLAHLVHQYRG